MTFLLVFTCSDGSRSEFFPIACRCESFEVQKRPAIACCARGLEDSPKANQRFLIDFVSEEQVVFVAEIPQEPVQLPQGLRRAIEPPGEGLARQFFGFEDRELEGKERLFAMPTIGGLRDSDEEHSFEEIVAVLGLQMQAREMAFHEDTSWDGAKLLSLQSRPERSRTAQSARWLM